MANSLINGLFRVDKAKIATAAMCGFLCALFGNESLTIWFGSMVVLFQAERIILTLKGNQ